MNLLHDGAVLDLQRRNVEILTEELKQMRDRFNVGELTRTHVAQAESRLAAERSQLLAAQSQYVTSRANFGRTSEVVESDTAHDGTTVTVRGGPADPAAVRVRRGRGPGAADAAAAETRRRYLALGRQPAPAKHDGVRGQRGKRRSAITGRWSDASLAPTKARTTSTSPLTRT